MVLIVAALKRAHRARRSMTDGFRDAIHARQAAILIIATGMITVGVIGVLFA